MPFWKCHKFSCTDFNITPRCKFSKGKPHVCVCIFWGEGGGGGDGNKNSVKIGWYLSRTSEGDKTSHQVVPNLLVCVTDIWVAKESMTAVVAAFIQCFNWSFHPRDRPCFSAKCIWCSQCHHHLSWWRRYRGVTIMLEGGGPIEALTLWATDH